MLSIDVPDLGSAPVTMEPREVRAGGQPEVLPGRVVLGGPFWTPLPVHGMDDPETAAFRTDPAWRWVLGVLTLSLDPDLDRGMRFERVWVDVTLVRPDQGLPQAVAWSMQPSQLVRSVSRSTRVAVTPSLKIADVGVDATVERGVQRELDDVTLEAYNEKTATPRWVLRRTDSAELHGCVRLALVVRAPRDREVRALLDIGVVTARRRAVFFWSRDADQQPRQVSVLP